MHPYLRTLLVRWAVNAVGVLVATQVIPGIEVGSFFGLLVAALLLGLLNAFVRPILTLVTLPLVLLSFGLFLWVINALLLLFVGWLVKPLDVSSFWSALGGAAVISLISWLAGSFINLNGGSGGGPRLGGSTIVVRQRRSRGDSGGPIIDV